MLPPLPSARDQPDLWADWINAAFADQPHRAAHLRRAYAEACRLPMTALTLEERRTVRLAALVHDVGRAVDPTDGLPHAISGVLLIEAAGLRSSLPPWLTTPGRCSISPNAVCQRASFRRGRGMSGSRPC